MKRTALILLACILSLPSCHKSGGEGDSYKGLLKETFTESEEVIPNPERGFYTGVEAHSASATPLTANRVSVARNQGRTLFIIEYFLTDYVNTPIGDDYMALIRTNFQVLRENGGKCILRFAYSNGYSEKDRPWDATEERVLQHVEQLKPLLREFSDVIFVLQAGFVGSWGEWYYTENFNMNPRTEEQYQPRKHLLDALLNAMPENRQVEVRTPAFKMKIYGFAVADTLTAGEAHTSSVKARLAGHNDCFLSSDSDVGTFNGKTEREYWMAESRYTIMGGESCELVKYCHCEDGENYDGAITTLEKYHFTYLHLNYHPQVISRWRQEKCFDQIDKRLGYRLVAREGYFTEHPKAGGDCRIVLKLENVGFAAPMNPRDAEWVLTDASGKVLQTYKVNADPRTWHSGMNTIDQTIQLPAGCSGQVSISLNLPDPEPTLINNPRFSIQLANAGVWNEKTGYNLIKTLTVE